MSAEECKSGKWRDPAGLEVSLSAASPEAYRDVVQRKLATGWVPLEPYPAAGVTWCGPCRAPEPVADDRLHKFVGGAQIVGGLDVVIDPGPPAPRRPRPPKSE